MENFENWKNFTVILFSAKNGAYRRIFGAWACSRAEISLYDSLWICLRLPMKSFLRRREDIQNIEKIGNLNMNHMVIYDDIWWIIWYIIRREISCLLRICIFAYAFKRKSRLKKFAWANPKNFYFAEFAV